MQSKKIARLEQQLTENIKLTHNHIWQKVSKDVGYLRRILNEVYIMRLRVIIRFKQIVILTKNYFSYDCSPFLLSQMMQNSKID